VQEARINDAGTLLAGGLVVKYFSHTQEFPTPAKNIYTKQIT